MMLKHLSVAACVMQLTLSTNVLASQIPWPVTTSVSFSKRPSGETILTARGTVALTEVQSPDSGVGDNHTALLFNASSIGSMYSYGSVGSAHAPSTAPSWYRRKYNSQREFSNAVGPVGTPWTVIINVVNGDTVCAVAGLGPTSPNLYHAVSREDAIQSAGALAMSYNPGVSSSALTCGVAPPTNVYCAMATPRVDIAYGAITTEQAEGLAKATPTTVTCTDRMAYQLKLVQGGGDINLSNGMKARITANGQALGSTLQGEQGPNLVTLSSTLAGKPTTSGPFTGADILFVTYP